MKLRTTLILLVLVIGLGAFWVFHTARQPSDSAYREQLERVFPSREFEDPTKPEKKGLSDVATAIELRDNQSLIALERPGTGPKDEWRISKPIQALADSGVVSSILSELEFLKAARILKAEKDQPLDMKAYGLEKPARSIKFTAAGKSWTLHIGDKTPDGKSVYASRADVAIPTVYVVPLSVSEKASKTVNEIRDKAALKFDKGAVTRLDIHQAGAKTIEIRKERTGWRMVQPIKDEAGSDTVTKLLDGLAGLRIEKDNFVAEDDKRAAEFGLDKPDLKIVVFEGGTSRALLVGSAMKDKAELLYAKREAEPTIFALEKKELEALRKSPTDLRSRTAISFTVSDATDLEVAYADKALKLKKKDDKWQFEKPENLTADHDQAQMLLNDLHNLEVKDWLDDPTPERVAQAGLAQSQITVTLKVKDDETPRVIRFGKSTDKPELTYARRGDEGPILIVPSDIPKRLAAGHLAFLSRKVLEFKRDDAESVRIARPSGAIALEKREGKWAVVEPQKAEADAARVDDLLWSLSYLEAKRLVAEKPNNLDEYGLSAPRIKASISVKQGEGKPSETKTLLIGKETEDQTSFAMLEGGDRVFTVGKTTVDNLIAEFIKKLPEPEKKPEEAQKKPVEEQNKPAEPESKAPAPEAKQPENEKK